MPRTRIKICGLTSVNAASVACQAGADAIGLMFYQPSPRHLALDLAREIRVSLPPFVDAVAVVVNPEQSYLREIVHSVGVSVIQFHGEETDEYCRSFGLPYIKVLRVEENTDLLAMESQYPGASGILLDTHVKSLYGGSGKVFDWQLANYAGAKPLVLAGGLHSGNVAEAISVTSPYAVDVSSGVETDGKKDLEKIAAFCQAVQISNQVISR